MGNKRAHLRITNGVSAIFAATGKNLTVAYAKSCPPGTAALKGWQKRVLPETEARLQRSSLAKSSFLLLFPTFSFLVLHRADGLVCREHMLDFGQVPVGLRAIAFRSLAVWAIKQMTKKEENSPS